MERNINQTPKDFIPNGDYEYQEVLSIPEADVKTTDNIDMNKIYGEYILGIINKKNKITELERRIKRLEHYAKYA